MKSIKLLSILFVFGILTQSNAQCPGAEAIAYKNKAQNAEVHQESEAYIFLAQYYAYKCECETGSPRSAQMVSMINQVVDTYAAYTQNKFGVITKVSTCKPLKEGQNTSGTSNANSYQNQYTKLNGFYDNLETIGNAVFGSDSDAGRMLQNLNASNQMWSNIENENYIGAAANLLSIFSNSKRREPKPVTPEEARRLKALQERKDKAEQVTLIKTTVNTLGLAQINDTTLVRVGEGEKIIITHKPIVNANDPFIYNTRKTFNIESGKLINEIIVNQWNTNATIKAATETNFEKSISTKTFNNKDGEVEKIVDLITDEIIYAKKGRVKEDIINEKGKVIGERYSYNNTIYVENYINKKKFIEKSIYYNGGIKNKEIHYESNEGYAIPIVIIDFDNQGEIRKKTAASYKQLQRNIRIITTYKKGRPIKEMTYTNGSLSKEKEL